jgi:phenylalanyl-tRNA synthetase alpha subunit
MNQWNALTDQERYTYELNARYHNEKAKFNKVSQFYDERIQSGKKHHPLPEMTDIFADVLSQMSVTTHQKKEIETSALDQAMIEKSTQD